MLIFCYTHCASIISSSGGGACSPPPDAFSLRVACTISSTRNKTRAACVERVRNVGDSYHRIVTHFDCGFQCLDLYDDIRIKVHVELEKTKMTNFNTGGFIKTICLHVDRLARVSIDAPRVFSSSMFSLVAMIRNQRPSIFKVQAPSIP